MRKNLTKEDIRFVADLCQIAIVKRDPGIRHQMHPVVPGHAWDERRALETAHYLLTLAAQAARRNVRRGEILANRAHAIMEVFGVVPEAEDGAARAALSSFSFPTGLKPL